MKKKVELVIRGGLVVTMDEQGTVFNPGSVAVSRGKIVCVGDEDEVLSQVDGTREISARGCAVMPGLVNVHTHAAMTCFRGLADDLPLMMWLTEHIFPAEKKINGDIVYKGTLLACAEMILGETTTFADMYLFADQVAKAAKEAKMRALIGEVIYDFPSPNYGSPEKGIQFTKALIDEWKGDDLISVAVEPHAVYTCSPQLLKECERIVEQFQVPLVIHLSENEEEIKQVNKKYGKTPVQHLDGLGLLGSKLLGVHCVVLTEKDMECLEKNDVKVAHNPESNMKLASGVSPVPDLLKRGITVGLGTDGCASNNDLDMWGEMDTCAKLHKVFLLDPTVMPAQKVVRMATIEGAKAIGMADRIGSLHEGKRADIIIVDLKKPHLTPMYQVYSHLVYSASAHDVKTSIINGEVVMSDRKLLTLDKEKVMESVKEIARNVIRPE